MLEAFENILYGTPSTPPHFPSISEFIEFFDPDTLTIIDNGDGTWVAVDYGNIYITMIDPTTFEIDHASTSYSDEDTYQISTTHPPLP